MTARDEVLARVRSALASAGAPPAPLPEPGPAPLAPDAAVERLRERLVELGVDVRDATEATLAETIAAACSGASTVIVPDDWPPAWTPAAAVRDGGRPAVEVGAFDAALTGARLGIAESGTIALDGGPHQGRRVLTLLPELHVCVLRAGDVVDSIGAAMTRLRPRGPGALTLVSGPSATTDIELTRIEGVHGPRKLVVILLARA